MNRSVESCSGGLSKPVAVRLFPLFAVVFLTSAFCPMVRAAAAWREHLSKLMVVDNVPPAAPSSPRLDPTADSGRSDTDDITNVTSPTFFGSAEPYAEVTLYAFGSQFAVVDADENGEWRFTSLGTWDDDRYEIHATATDEAGNTSAPSAIRLITIDSQAPSLTGLPEQRLQPGATSDALAFVLSDAITMPANIWLTAATSNPNVVALADIVLDGSGADRTVTLTASASGTTTITLQAEDEAGNINTMIFTVVVNTAPTIAGTPAIDVNPGQVYTFAPLAEDSDIGDVLTFEITNKPNWAAFDTATGILTGMPRNVDIGTTSGIVISVSDGALSASLLAFDLEVNNVPLNAAPVVGNLHGDQVAYTAGVTVELDAGGNAWVSDEEDDLANWNGASLMVQRITNGAADPSTNDIFDFAPNWVHGGSLQNAGLTFATFTNSEGVLTINFTGSDIPTSTMLVEYVVRSITYRNDTPYGDAVIRFMLTDSGGATVNSDVTLTCATIYADRSNDDADGDAADGFSLREALARGVAQAGSDDIRVMLADNSTVNFGSDLSTGAGDILNLDNANGLTMTGSTINLGGALIISNGMGDHATLASRLTGNATVTKMDYGTLILTNTDNRTGFAGDIAINGGVLSVGHADALGNGPLLFDGGTLVVSHGGTEIPNNMWFGNGGGKLHADVDWTASGVCSGSGILHKVGQFGTLTLSGTSAHTGTTVLGEGNLTIGGDSNLGSGPVSVYGGYFSVNTTGQTIDNDFDITSRSGAIELWNGVEVTLSGLITGTGDFFKGGNGTLILTNTGNGASNWTFGQIHGKTVVTEAGQIGGGILKLAGGTLAVNASDSFSLDRVTQVIYPVTLDATGSGSGVAVSLGGMMSGSGDLTINAGESHVYLGNAGNLTGNLTLASTGDGLVAASGAGTLGSGQINLLGGSTLGMAGSSRTFGNDILLMGNVTFRADSSATGNEAVTFSGVIADGGGAYNLTVYGNAVGGDQVDVVLSGNNTYTGTTTLMGGKLDITGSIASKAAVHNGTLAATGTINGAVTVTDGKLMGTGTINGDVVIDSGSTLAPGGSPGTLTINGDLAIHAGGTLEVELNGMAAGTGHDQLLLNGEVDITAAMLSVILGYPPGFEDNYILLANDGAEAITGGFYGLPEGATITAGGNGIAFTASYTGGSGNDFTLTAPPNTPPVIGNLDGDGVDFIEGSDQILLASGGDATVSDSDSPDFAGGHLTVSIVANRVDAEDMLFIRKEGTGPGQIDVLGLDITYAGTPIGTRNAEGGWDGLDLIISLNGAATQAAVQALVNNLTYRNTNEVNPDTTARTVRLTIDDGDGGASTSAPVDITVTVIDVNDPPTLTTHVGYKVFEEGDTEVILFNSTSINTVEAGQLIRELTFTVESLADGGDEILGIDGSEIPLVTGSHTTPTNALAVDVVLTDSTAKVTVGKAGGMATALVEAVIDGMNYRNTDVDPYEAHRIVTLTGIRDNGGIARGGNDSSTLNIATVVAVLAVNSAPVVTTSGTVAAFIEGNNEPSAPVFIDAGITVSDIDNTTLESAQIRFHANFQPGEDVLSFTNDGSTMGNITGTYDGSTGLMTLISSGSSATLVEWQHALAAVTYTNSSDRPWDGTRQISFAVFDGTQYSDMRTQGVSVTPVNDTPIISGTPDTTVNQGQYYLFSPMATDVDWDGVMEFTIINKPTWAVFNPYTGRLTGTPRNGDVGTTTGIVITVSDGSSSTSLPAFDLEVVNVNDAPIINGFAFPFVNQDDEYSFIPVAQDVDGDDLTFSIINKPDWATFDTATGALTGTPGNEHVGKTSGIVITVSDGELRASTHPFDITVYNVNDAPVIMGTPATSVDQDASYSFYPTAYDIDPGDTIVFSIINRPDWASFDWVTGALTGTPGNADVGVTKGVVITVKDLMSSTSLPAFDLTVANVNDAPMIDGLPATVVSQDAGYSFVPTASDIDVGDELEFSIENKPEWALFDSATGELSGTPLNEHVGVTTGIVISVSDGSLNASLPAFDLEVTTLWVTGVSLTATTFTYDGTPKSLEVSGTLPVGANVTYLDNDRTDAGSQTVTATVSGTGYTPLVLTAVLIIDKAQPVITAAATQHHMYDGVEKTIMATVMPVALADRLQYSPQRSFTDVGEHRVRVYLDESANYLGAEAYTDFAIASASQQGLVLADRTVTYDGLSHSLEVTGAAAGATVNYTINGLAGNSAVNAGSYEVVALVRRSNYVDETLTGTLIIDRAVAQILGDENQVFTFDGTAKLLTVELSHGEGSLSYDPGNSFTDAGTYTVTVSADRSANYQAVSKTFTLRIDRAAVTGLSLVDATHTYDGLAKTLGITGNLPDGATVVYTIDGVIGNSATDAGTYTVEATISGVNHTTRILTATLRIDKAQPVITAAATQRHTYDGAEKTVMATVLPVALADRLQYSPQRSFTDVGEYRVRVYLDESANYLGAEAYTDFAIASASQEGLVLADRAVSYDGLSHSLEVTGAPEGATVIYTINGEIGNSAVNAGSYEVVALVRRSNYVDEILTGTLIIDRAVAQILGDENQVFTFDGTAKLLTVELSHGEGSLSYDPGNSFTDAGTYAVTVSASQSANYQAVSKMFTLRIDKAEPVITAAVTQRHTYDGAEKTVMATVLPVALADRLQYSPQRSFTDVGEHRIRVYLDESANYLGAEAYTDFAIASADQQGLALADRTVTYNGLSHSLEVTGAAPDATIVYTINGETGNSAVNAGVYDVVAVVRRSGYADETLTGTLIINRAAVTGISLDDAAHTYDGSAKISGITGNLPDGVTVVYTIDGVSGNSVTDAGSYTVEATISGVNHTTRILTAALRIDKAQPVITASATQCHTYDGAEKTVMATVLPIALVDRLQYSPQRGFTNVGEHRVRIYLEESANYLGAEVYTDFTIASAGQQGLALADRTVTYDGLSHSLEVTGAAPDAMIVYTINGETGNSAVNAGLYDVVAVVRRSGHADETLTGTLIINRSAVTGISLGDATHTYDGSAKTLGITGNLPDGATVVYTIDGAIGNSATDADTYTVEATISGVNHTTRILTATLRIDKAQPVITASATQRHTYDGTEKTVMATVLPVALADRLQYSPQRGFTNVGEHRVRVYLEESANYLGAETYTDFTIASAGQQGLVLADRTVTYDGLSHSLEVTGTAAGATVIYTINGETGNSAVNAGVYDVVAVVRRSGHADETLTGTLIINRAAVTGISLDDATHTYDGSAKTLGITGNLPDGATAVYTIDGVSGNSATDAGSYTVEATIGGDNHTTRVLTATLRIDKAQPVITAAVTQRHTYDGAEKTIMATVLPVALADRLQYSPQRGFINVGEHRVRVYLEESANYLGAEAYTDFTIASAGQQGLALADRTVTYDGLSHSLEVTGAAAGATVIYTINGETGNSAVNAGSYEVVALVRRSNYADETLTGTLIIDRAAAQLLGEGSQVFTFDGTAKSLTVELSHGEGSLSYDPGNSFTDAGTYTVTVSADRSANYQAVSKTFTLRIDRAAVTGLSLVDATHTYDGLAKTLGITGNLPDGATVVYTIDGVIGNSATDAGTYTVEATINGVNHTTRILTATLRIDKAQPVITAAATQRHTYDGAEKTVMATVLPVALADRLQYIPQRGFTNVGEHRVRVYLDESANYLGAETYTDFTIASAGQQELTLPDLTVIYNGLSHSLEVTGAAPDATIVYTINGQAGNSAVNAGGYEVVAIVRRTNHADETLTGRLTISKATAVITAQAEQRYTYNGLANPVHAALNHAETALTYDPQASFTAVGTHTVTVTAAETANYRAARTTVTLRILSAGQEGLSLPDRTVTYTGQPHSLSVSGLAEDATVTYIINGHAGNSAVNAGVYDVVAVVRRSGHSDETLTGTLIIDRAAVTGISLSDATHTYDGLAKTLGITGDLPDGTTVVYTIDGAIGNSATDAGTYTIEATISGVNHTTQILTATLRIEKAQPVITAAATQRHTYDGAEKTVMATVLPVALADRLQYSPQSSFTDVGEHRVRVYLNESANYLAAAAYIDFSITPAGQQDLSLASRTVVYTGQAHSLSVQGLAAGVKVVYTINGEPGNSAVNAGSYEVVAVVIRPNYSNEALTGTLTIARATISDIRFENTEFIYHGAERQILIAGGLPAGTTVNYWNNNRTAVGNQQASATISGANHITLTLTATLAIRPATRSIDFPVLPAKVYGDVDFASGATASSGESINYTSSNPAVATVTGGIIRIMGAGTAEIKATVANNANYSTKPEVSRTLMVAKASQAITLSAPAEVNRDAGSVAITATSSSGLPVSLHIDDQEVAMLSGTTLHIHRLGTVRITATQAGDTNHHAAEARTITLRVVDPSSNFPIRVSNAVSPNGDGTNDYLVIEAIRDHPDNRIRIFNRNGTVVYEVSGYDNNRVRFEGIGTGQYKVPAGTYFYTAEIRVNGEWVYEKGWFVLRY